jgi:hypothetical protein
VKIPGFNAAASLYQASRSYHVSDRPRQAAHTLQPALIPQPQRGSCWAVCGGDPDCVQCCLCVRHGGHPWQCCF